MINPSSVTSHPGARVIFSTDDLLSDLTYGNYEVIAYFPSRPPENATIHESDNTFSYVIPPVPGVHTVQFTVTTPFKEQKTYSVRIDINPAQAPEIPITTSTAYTPIPPVYADVYSPTGELMESKEMTKDGKNYTTTIYPGADWKPYLHQVYVRDQSRVRDVIPVHVHRPQFASMPLFFSLPNWQRQILEYVKYELMSDVGNTPPDAYADLEGYTKHWYQVVEEINNMPPSTGYSPPSIPRFWANVMVKGTMCRMFHSLANRSVTIPRFSSNRVAIQDESHLQGSWEARYKMMREEYEEERAYMKARHLPDPSVTIDSFRALAGNTSGQFGALLLSRPSWYSNRLA